MRCGAPWRRRWRLAVSPEGKKAGNRSRFPETARVVDQFRAVFGPEVRCVWCEENGESRGKLPEEAEFGYLRKDRQLWKT